MHFFFIYILLAVGVLYNQELVQVVDGKLFFLLDN